MNSPMPSRIKAILPKEDHDESKLCSLREAGHSFHLKNITNERLERVLEYSEGYFLNDRVNSREMYTCERIYNKLMQCFVKYL